MEFHFLLPNQDRFGRRVLMNLKHFESYDSSTGDILVIHIFFELLRCFLLFFSFFFLFANIICWLFLGKPCLLHKKWLRVYKYTKAIAIAKPFLRWNFAPSTSWIIQNLNLEIELFRLRLCCWNACLCLVHNSSPSPEIPHHWKGVADCGVGCPLPQIW